MTDTIETIKFHKMIGGKLHPFELKKARFEKTVDAIDKAVDKGATHKQVLAKFSDMIVSSKAEPVAKEKPVTKSAAPVVAGSKSDYVQSIINANPNLTAGQVAKKASENGSMTYANAYYLASKLKKG